MSFKKPGGGGEVYYYRFRDIAVRTYVSIITSQRGTWSERVTISVKIQKVFGFC